MSKFPFHLIDDENEFVLAYCVFLHRLKEVRGARGPCVARSLHLSGRAVGSALLCCCFNGPGLCSDWRCEGGYYTRHQHVFNNNKHWHMMWLNAWNGFSQWLRNCCNNAKCVFLSSVRLMLLFAAQGSQDLTEETESMMESSAPRLRRCGYCLFQVTIGIGR